MELLKKQKIRRYDSFAILSIVSELQDTYDITITPADIIPENFNSAKALWDMVCRLKG